MNKIYKKIELLAPAKNLECAMSAINAGADAVYIGAADFGARKKAGNSIEDIKELVEYAHKYYVKIYVTVNTIIFDNEIKLVEDLIWKLYEIGVDAIIFQDFSFFEMKLPPIPLHASTQCNNDSIDKIKFLKNCNVERVVLPREFSLDEIKKVISNVDIETEVFIHGALCVSYSGQCYMSNFIGKRSANRGECAQPCRKKYKLIDENNNTILDYSYLLSMKDNNLSGHIKELVDAGVSSLKIEGRLKDKEYVTNVVSYYRNLIDNISPRIKTSIGDIYTDFKADLNKTFNRTYTNFYFDGQRKDFINSITPKFLGEKVAEVMSVKNNVLNLKLTKQLHISDKIAYFDAKKEITGTTVTKILSKSSVEVLDASSISKGTEIYRNFDFVFSSILKKSEFVRKIPLSIEVNNTRIKVELLDNKTLVYNLSKQYQVANNLQKAKENMSKQLSKMGETEFIVSKISVDNDFNLFIPVSQINEIRREIVQMLQRQVEDNFKRTKRNTSFDIVKYPIKSLDYSFNISNKLSKVFYEKCGSVVEEYSPECGQTKSKLTLMKTKHCLRHYAGLCKQTNHDKKKLFLVDEFGISFPLEFDCKSCVMKIKEP